MPPRTRPDVDDLEHRDRRLWRAETECRRHHSVDDRVETVFHEFEVSLFGLHTSR